jgi:hypothetical protein
VLVVDVERGRVGLSLDWISARRVVYGSVG